jgi:YesN/AraC family two-component response regulator
MIKYLLDQPPQIKKIHKVPYSAGYYTFMGLMPAAMILFDSSVDLITENNSYNIKKNTIGFFCKGTKRKFLFNNNCIHRTVHLETDHLKIKKQEPFLIDTANEFKYFLNKYDHAFRMKDINQMHSQAILWELIWSINEVNKKNENPHTHPVLLKALDLIEDNLDKKITISQLANKLKFSQSQLNILFKSNFKLSTEAYLKKRRMEEAKTYLTQTDMSIKEVAYRVGYPDLQHFNKIIRSYYNQSPRAFRT